MMTATNQVGFEIQILRGKYGWLNSVTKKDGVTPYIFETKASADAFLCALWKNTDLEYRVYPSLRLPDPKLPCTTPCIIAENSMCKFCLFNNGTQTK